MAFDDKDLGSIFPVRTGAPQGQAVERKMLTSVNDTSNFRTRLMNNPDGSTTMLRTKGGMPQFSTNGLATIATEFSGMPHSLVVKAAENSKAKFYIRNNLGAWSVSITVPSYQQDVVNYWSGITTAPFVRPVVVALTSTKRLDLSSKPIPESIPQSPQLTALFDGANYLYASPSVLYGVDYLPFYTLEIPDIPTLETSVHIAPVHVSEHGDKVVLLGYRFGEMPVTNQALLNFRSVVAALGTATVSETIDVQMQAPIPMDTSGDSNDSGAGPKRGEEAKATYMTISQVPGSPGVAGTFGEGVLGQPGSYSFFAQLIYWMRNDMATEQNQSAGFHDVYTQPRTRKQTVKFDGLPASVSIDLAHTFSFSGQRAESRALLDNYLHIVAVGRGEGLWDDAKFIKDINYTTVASNSVKLLIGEGAGLMELTVFESSGTGSGSGKRNQYNRRTFSSLPRTQPWEGEWLYQLDGGPYPTNAEYGEYAKTYFDAHYPSVVDTFPPQYPYDTNQTTTYDTQGYAGSAAQESTSVHLIDCDARLHFAVGIECHVSVAASFSGGEEGKWSTGATLNSTTHNVRVSLVWWYRGVKRTKDLYTGIVVKRAALYARLIYAYMASLPDDPDGTYTLEPLEINPPAALYKTLINIRNGQGVSPHYAGFSETDALLGVDTGLEYSTGSIRQERAMDGMVYYRKIKLSDFPDCDWLFDATDISAPLSRNPFETNPVLTRPYGYSDALYDLFTNGEFLLELRDGIETPWTNDFEGSGTISPICYRV